MLPIRRLSSILIAVAALTVPAAAQNAGQGAIAPPALLTKVNLQFENATVPEAAAALAKVSGVPIRVDLSVPSDTRLSITAHDINAGSILMTIADDADLRIDPDDGGVILRQYPYLVVNGTKSVQKNLGAPWGPGWSQPVGIPRNPIGPASMSVSSSRVERSGAGSSSSVYRGVPSTTVNPALPGESGAGVAVTSVGDHMVVVALPGENDQGVRGVWLALFRVDGTQFHWLSSAFHALGEAPGATATGGAAAR
ncbi:MAG TPA: hypothetical protein VFJ58_11800 [Armatimonadota bacterium]|nr:hypothetical protein [Armatimonadota bacterium]